jgi:nickel/cobalt exporter
MSLICRLAAVLALLGLAVLILGAASADAQQNPLLGRPAAPDTGTGDTATGDTGPSDTGAPPTAGQGPLHRLQGIIIATQRDVNREINRRLIAVRDGHGVGVVFAGLVIAFLYGVFHAIGPGHGKTVFVGYFLGRGGGIGRGVTMAGWIALSHVVGAIAIVTVAHVILSRSLATPVEEVRSLQLVSYGAILAIGLVMLTYAIRDRRRGAAAVCHDHGRHGHDCGHHHGIRAWREQRLLAIAAGFIPCSGAILILVFAFTNGILLSGILMALAIALGMGITLAVLGIAAVLTRRQAESRFAGIPGVDTLLGLLGPVLVTAIGGLLLSGALLESGAL